MAVVGLSTFQNDVHLLDSDNLYIGGSVGTTDGMRLYHNGNNSFITNNNRTFYFGQNTTASAFPLYVTAGNEFYLKHTHSNGGQNSVIKSIRGGAFTLYHAAPNVPSAEHVRLETTSTGINFPRDIDVDGHTELDDLNVTGVSTFSNTIFTGTISAGSTTGTNGYYLKTTGIGVTWAAFPSSRTTDTQIATAGQTTFNFSYNVGYVDVFLNGVKLPESEFVASNGSTIVLDAAAFANDTLEFVSYNTVPNSSAGAQNLTGLADITITGTPVIGETLQHNGSVFVNDYTVSTTTTSTSQATISSLPIATYRSVEYTIQVTEGTKYHVTKVLAIHDGTNVSFNEYGTLTTSTSLSTFTLDVNSGNMRLLATPASTNSTVFKVKFTGIKV